MLISTSFQKNHHQKLISGVKHIFIRSGNCWVGRFCWKPRWFLKRPGVIPDAKKERTHSVPPIWQRPRWRHEPRIFYASWTLWTWTCHCSWVREHFNVSLSLCIIHVYLSCSLSLSLSLYIYNGFLPHFPFTACTCSYFCNNHTVDEVYCNEIHLICKDTSTYAKESRGQNFSPQQEPLVWKWIQKKGLYSAVLNPANSPSPSDLGRVDPFGGVVPPGPMAGA